MFLYAKKLWTQKAILKIFFQKCLGEQGGCALQMAGGWSGWSGSIGFCCLFVAQDLWPIVRSAHGDFEPWRQQFGRENCKINWVSTQAKSTCQHQIHERPCFDTNSKAELWTQDLDSWFMKQCAQIVCKWHALILDGRPTFWRCSRLGQKIHSQRSWRTVA